MSNLVYKINEIVIKDKNKLLEFNKSEKAYKKLVNVIRAAQRNIHQCKNGINKTLRSAQGQPEHAFNDQNGGDGKVRIALRSAS